MPTLDFLPKQNEFLGSAKREIIYSGGFGSGKSLALCAKVVFLLTRYNRNRGYLCRNTLQSLKSTTLKTLLDGDGGVPPILPRELIKSHNKQDRVIVLHNNSELWYGPMDKEFIKSMNLGFAAVDEATEIEEEDWNALIGRLRLNGVPVRQIFGATNPSSDSHWIYNRFEVNNKRPDRRKIIFSSTLENKFLPAEYIESLKQSHFGHFYSRYVLGLWVGSDKLVYDNFDRHTHVIKNFTIPRNWKRYRTVDFGYKSPFSCLWIALAGPDAKSYGLTPNDVVVYRELYFTERTTSINAQRINEFSKYENGDNEVYNCTIADWDSGDRADLEANGIPTIKANKDILFGIQKVRERLGNQDTNKGDIRRPSLFIFENTLVEYDPKIRTNTIGETNNNPTKLSEEFMAHCWKTVQGKLVEIPEDKHNHALDSLRYFITYYDLKPIWKTIEFKKV